MSFVVNVPTTPTNETLLFTATGQPTIDSSGDLSYTPAPGASGTATISVQLEATTAGGQDGISHASQFTIMIGSVAPQLAVPISEFTPAGSGMVLGSSSLGGIYRDGDTDTSAQVTAAVNTNWGTLTYTDASGNVHSGDTADTFSGTIAVTVVRTTSLPRGVG